MKPFKKGSDFEAAAKVLLGESKTEKMIFSNTPKRFARQPKEAAEAVAAAYFNFFMQNAGESEHSEFVRAFNDKTKDLYKEAAKPLRGSKEELKKAFIRMLTDDDLEKEFFDDITFDIINGSSRALEVAPNLGNSRDMDYLEDVMRGVWRGDRGSIRNLMNYFKDYPSVFDQFIEGDEPGNVSQWGFRQRLKKYL